MTRVKFNVNTEYAFLQNFKVLQSTNLSLVHSCRLFPDTPFPLLVASSFLLYYSTNIRMFSDVFTRHQIDRPVPVEALVKCRMQDNLEFLQWTKRFWDQNYPGGEYDALARRKGSTAPPGGGSRAGATSASGARRGGTTPTANAGRPRVAGAGATGGGGNSAALTQEINAQKEAIAGLEKERDFYFGKLRDIELLLGQAVEADPELEKDDDSLVKHIQAILYSTEVCPENAKSANPFEQIMPEDSWTVV